MSRSGAQAVLERGLGQRLRGLGQRSQREFPSGLIVGSRALDRGGGVLEVARVDRVEPAVVAPAIVGARHGVGRIDAESLQAARDVGTQHLHGGLHRRRRGVLRAIGRQAGADQQEHGIVEQRLRHAHLPLQVLAQQQVGARGEALGEQVGRQQPVRQRAEHHRQRQPDAPVRGIGGAARVLFVVANIVQRDLQRQVGFAQQRAVRAGRGQAQRLEQRGLEALARARDRRRGARGQHDAGQHLQFLQPQVGRMHALLLHQDKGVGVGLEQAQRILGIAGHQVIDILGQGLHAAPEHAERLRAGGDGTGVDGFQQAAHGLAVCIHAAQADDVHRPGGLVQLLAGQAQRRGVARAQRLGGLLDLVHIVAKLGGGVVQRGAQAWRKPGQHRQVALRHGGRHGRLALHRRLRRGRVSHVARYGKIQ
ncbi:hypothetical protein D3C87_1169350 [compost metagenome]